MRLPNRVRCWLTLFSSLGCELTARPRHRDLPMRLPRERMDFDSRWTFKDFFLPKNTSPARHQFWSENSSRVESEWTSTRDGLSGRSWPELAGAGAMARMKVLLDFFAAPFDLFPPTACDCLAISPNFLLDFFAAPFASAASAPSWPMSCWSPPPGSPFISARVSTSVCRGSCSPVLTPPPRAPRAPCRPSSSSASLHAGSARPRTS